MRCPFCGAVDTSVKDSRAAEDASTIRRRRHCSECEGRFTTVEHVQLLALKVIKKSGEVEPLKREKILSSLKLALHKRPVDDEKLEKITNTILRRLETTGETEIKSTMIGELVMEMLYDLDKVAFVRFASIYKDFDVVDDFKNFIKSLNKN